MTPAGRPGHVSAPLPCEPWFTTPHFDGYAAVLVELDAVDPDPLAELIEDAWLARAPKRLAARYRNADPDDR